MRITIGKAGGGMIGRKSEIINTRITVITITAMDTKGTETIPIIIIITTTIIIIIIIITFLITKMQIGIITVTKVIEIIITRIRILIVRETQTKIIPNGIIIIIEGTHKTITIITIGFPDPG